MKNCKQANEGYTIVCKLCKSRNIERSYEGESCRNGYICGKEHNRELEKKTGNSVLYKHIIKEHE